MKGNELSYPAAESVMESILSDEGWKLDPLEAEFLETLLWYDAFKNKERMKLLPYSQQDLEVITRKMEDSRARRDFQTADYLREGLRKAGVTVKNKGGLASDPDKP